MHRVVGRRGALAAALGASLRHVDDTGSGHVFGGRSEGTLVVLHHAEAAGGLHGLAGVAGWGGGGALAAVSAEGGCQVGQV